MNRRAEKMYCSKCAYTSFDHLSRCPKCGFDWNQDRIRMNLDWLQEDSQPWLNLECAELDPLQGDYAENYGKQSPHAMAGSREQEFEPQFEPDMNSAPLSLELGLEEDSGEEKQRITRRSSLDLSREMEFPDQNSDFSDDTGMRDK